MKYRYDIYGGLTKIKTKLFYGMAGLGLVLGGGGLSLAAFGTAHAATCQSVTTSKGTFTAAQVGGTVRGKLDATGCQIGVYFDGNDPGKVSQANIFGATEYGVFVDGQSGNVKVNVSQSSIHNIGDNPFDGVQYGVGVYYNSLKSNGHTTSGDVTGRVSQNHVYDYQKGGIVVNGPNTSVPVSQNTVNGLGPVDFIAQNGIQISRGASGTVSQNTVTDNSYTGDTAYVSAGILIYGGWGDPLTKDVTIVRNTVRNNDIGVYAAQYNNDANAGPNKPTSLNITHNIISSNAVNNRDGNGGGTGYQAGISDSGNSDRITYNSISGAGYKPENDSTAVVLPIDASAPYSINPTLSHNTYDGKAYPS